jgi:3-methyladenine DNA glycosylase AlkD
VNVDEIADGLEARLRGVGTPERAAGEKAYLKSDLDFLGVRLGEINAAARDVLRDHPDIVHDELVALAGALWSVSVFERRMAAVEVLARSTRLLSTNDLSLVERLLRESRTWALVDAIADDIVGQIVQRDPDEATPVMDRWAIDDDFWVRRASLLCELRPIRHGATLDRFVARADPMLEEREFFIRKAIGWVLREAGKRRPGDVVAWLAPRTHRASGVTMREAVKYLPPEDADRLMIGYRERRAV